jgi:hypothetical protein
MSAYAAGMVEGTGTVDEAAAAVGLGKRGGAFTAVQHIPLPVAWAVVGAAAVTGLLLSFARAYIVAALLVPAALIGLAVVRYRLAPSGGRRRLMLYQHGTAEVVTPPGGRVRTCNYRFTDGTSASQTMVRTTWEVTLREARTGRVIVAATFVGGDTACSRFPDYSYSSLPPTIAKEQRSRATDQQRYQYANKYLGATV